MDLTRPLESLTREAFYKHVRIDPAAGCHVWTGRATPSLPGYPRAMRFRFLGGDYSARHVAWDLKHGRRVWIGRLKVTCGNHYCVNPDHASFESRETPSRPFRPYKVRKLTEAQIIYIRDSRRRIADLARQFNISFMHAWEIRHRRQHKNILAFGSPRYQARKATGAVGPSMRIVRQSGIGAGAREAPLLFVIEREWRRIERGCFDLKTF